MKKLVIAIVVLSAMSFAAKGGCAPCLATCFLGPRVGVEMNEGSKIRNAEFIGLVGNIVFPQVGSIYMAIDPTTGKTMNQVRSAEALGGVAVNATAPKAKGGPLSFLTSCCFGPRVALEANDGRQIRTLEWLRFIPVVNIYPALYLPYEAFAGKTMSEIVAEEGLDK